MKLPRRNFLHLAAAAAGLPAVSRIASAQAYPSRPVRWIVGYAPGGPNDINARLIGQWLSERMGQQFITDNRPGASGNIAMESVVRSPPDGYTLGMVALSDSRGGTAGRPGHRRICGRVTRRAGLRALACLARRPSKQGDQRWPLRFHDEGADYQSR
jgi:Tripartite tricarboxylate transporter family receptor